MFDLKYVLGSQELKKEVAISNVAVVKGDLLVGVSGYASNAYSSFVTSLMIGVAQQTVDNSGGSAGAKVALVEMSPLAIYAVDTGDTMTAAYQWTNVACASANTVTSATAKTDKTGIVKLMQMISASKATCRINFSSPTEA